MQIRWSALAVEDLEKIHEWIARSNAEAAVRLVRAIYERCGQLEHFPESGPMSHRLPGRRELVSPGTRYVVVYRLRNGLVEISRVYHGAQNRGEVGSA